MRAARPDELKQNAFPVMTAELSEAELTKWFPVSFEEITDPWAAPELSKGALVRLEAGEYVVLEYGKESEQLTLRIPSTVDPSSFLTSFFHEVPLPRSRVLWHRAGTRLPRTVAANRVGVGASERQRGMSSLRKTQSSKKK
jgi:hypothetical protein